MKEYYKITEVARLYGLCTDTLRYYEEQGLLHPHRSEAGYRLYSIDDICNLNVIRALRELDMPVEHMRRYFEGRTVASTLDMLDEQDAAIRARIAALRDARAAVDARVWSGMTGRSRACCACWSCRNVPACNCRRMLSWSARSTSH